MTFDIYFSGQVSTGRQQAEVAEQLQQRMKLTEEKVGRLFGGARILLKRDLDQPAAEKYVAIMASLGAIVEVSPPLPAVTAFVQAPELTLAPVEAKASAEQSVVQLENADPYATTNAAAGSQLYCRQCGTALAAAAAHCHRCGAPQVQGSQKSRFVAALLAFFLGWVGAHRLYLGQWWGVLYILLYPIMWLVSLVEAIVFVCTPAARWNVKYGNVPPGNGLLLAVAGLLGFVFIGGILAAVSIPAYQDYTIRARVSKALTWSSKYRDDASAFYIRVGYLPTSSAEIGVADDLRLDASGRLQLSAVGDLVLSFEDIPAIENETLIWQADIVDGIPRWQCKGGTLPNKYRPVHCRGEQGSSRSAHNQSGGAGKLNIYRSDDGELSIALRGDWEPLQVEGAVLSYLNSSDDIGVAVVVEERELFEPGETLDGYRDALVEYSFGDVTDLQYQFLESRSINGVPAQIFRIDGFLNGVAVTAITAAAEGNDNFYKISSWTSTERGARNVEQMLAALYSFELAAVSSTALPARRR